jgi:hypothetical protein
MDRHDHHGAASLPIDNRLKAFALPEMIRSLRKHPLDLIHPPHRQRASTMSRSYSNVSLQPVQRSPQDSLQKIRQPGKRHTRPNHNPRRYRQQKNRHADSTCAPRKMSHLRQKVRPRPRRLTPHSLLQRPPEPVSADAVISGKRVRRYRAMFPKGQVVWTVGLSSSGAILTLDPSQE